MRKFVFERETFQRKKKYTTSSVSFMSSPETSINPPKDNNGAKAMNRCEVKSREIWNFIPFRIMS